MRGSVDSITLANYFNVRAQEVLAEFRKLKDEGVVREVGFISLDRVETYDDFDDDDELDEEGFSVYDVEFTYYAGAISKFFEEQSCD
jgi:predicted aldo/keto reductase-like oxidoreductase